ncbi:DinB family protein [Cellulomonas soli]|uniref:DinB family protein n=1 Tax=Cellulomonas soli TaxID=931535 RepID=UPI003F8776E9
MDDSTPTSAPVEIDEHGRPEPPLTGDETATLLGFLDYQRATLAWKTAGLDAAGLGARLAPTSMTLGGLLKHLAYVESDWFSRALHDRPRQAPWDAVDWAADPDWDWHSAAADTPDQLRALWQREVDRSRALVADALRTGGLDQIARRRFEDGTGPSLRWILTHMIEEYARHNGHADLLREHVDGQVGE